MATPRDFADYCCELLAGIGPCTPRRMFSGWGLSLDGLSVAIVVNLGQGDTLWLKADDETRARFEAAGCARFSYGMRKGDAIVERSMNYYAAPEDAMDSPDAMAPWARLALESALAARAAKPPGKTKASPAKAGKASKTPASAGTGKKTSKKAANKAAQKTIKTPPTTAAAPKAPRRPRAQG